MLTTDNKTIVFCNALPTTYSGYTNGLASTYKDFMHHYKRSRLLKTAGWDWHTYRNELVVPYQTLKEGYQDLGIVFKDECTWEDFKAILLQEKFMVVILFSHCIKNNTPLEEIEFFDGMVKSDLILEALPNQKRLYDFAVCDSMYLQSRITNEKSESVAGTSSDPVLLGVWIAVYAMVFERMIVKREGFIYAMNEVFIEAKIRNAKKGI